MTAVAYHHPSAQAPRAQKSARGLRIVTWVVAGLMVVALLLGLGYYLLGRALHQSLGHMFDGLGGLVAAQYAWDGNGAAALHHVPDAALTAQVLNQWNDEPSVTWVDVNTSVTPDGASGSGAVLHGGATPTYVSVGVGVDHILTATNAGGTCSFGLVVSSPKDPIIAADHLVGTGTYGIRGSRAHSCSASSAPDRGWMGLPFP